MPVPLGKLVFWTVLASTPLALLVFRARAWGGGFFSNLRRILVDYRWHLALLFFVVVEKTWVKSLNHLTRGVLGDYTWLIHRLEGEAVYRLQSTLEHPSLTAAFNAHYLWMFLFMTYFTVLLWAYRDDRELANMAVLSTAIIYLLAVPFYIFFNVQVTSDFIPGMKSLMYHSSPGFYDFFVRADPLDNAFPSLHTAIPVGLILTAWWAMRRRGYTIWNWEHRAYLWFMIVNLAVFLVAILYLGIHWILDIPGGIFIGLLGAIIADELRFDTFRILHSAERRALAPLHPLLRRLAPLWRRIGLQAR